jgi:hypothetical protein
MNQVERIQLKYDSQIPADEWAAAVAADHAEAQAIARGDRDAIVKRINQLMADLLLNSAMANEIGRALRTFEGMVIAIPHDTAAWPHWYGQQLPRLAWCSIKNSILTECTDKRAELAGLFLRLFDDEREAA